MRVSLQITGINARRGEEIYFNFIEHKRAHTHPVHVRLSQFGQTLNRLLSLYQKTVHWALIWGGCYRWKFGEGLRFFSYKVPKKGKMWRLQKISTQQISIFNPRFSTANKRERSIIQHPMTVATRRGVRRWEGARVQHHVDGSAISSARTYYRSQ